MYPPSFIFSSLFTFKMIMSNTRRTSVMLINGLLYEMKSIIVLKEGGLCAMHVQLGAHNTLCMPLSTKDSHFCCKHFTVCFTMSLFLFYPFFSTIFFYLSVFGIFFFYFLAFLRNKFSFMFFLNLILFFQPHFFYDIWFLFISSSAQLISCTFFYFIVSRFLIFLSLSLSSFLLYFPFSFFFLVK